MPKNIQTIVENELINICYITLLSVDCGDWAAAQSRREGIKIFDEIEKMLIDLDKSIVALAKQWPAGKSVIMSLTNVSNILQVWLSNFSAWGKLVWDYSDDLIDLAGLQEKYRSFVMKNREYHSQVDDEFTEIQSKLSDLKIDFQEIVLQSKAKINKSVITKQARAKTQAIFDELWQSGRISHDQAVIKLAEHMDLSTYDINISSFDVGQCGLVLTWVKTTKFELGI